MVRFAPNRGRDVPLFVAQLPIFSRAYYTGRPFDETTLDVPLGSGPYKVGRFEAGRYIEYERVKDWWGADLPVVRGFNNFDVLRFEFYRDQDVAFEGFTGKSYLFREEVVSRVWATRYDFPAIRDGRVKREVLPDDTPSGAQGWFINTRRDTFGDRRLREALGLAFDFEWTNKNIMYGAYKRTVSVFQNSDMMAQGPPGPEELALLAPFRGQVPDEVFGEPFVPPVSDGSGQDRAMLRKAAVLLQSAGIVLKDGKRVTPKGERVTIEFLVDEPDLQPHHLPFIKNLATLGIDATLRMVDAGAVSRPPRRLRFRHYDGALPVRFDPGRQPAPLLHIAGGGQPGLVEPGRHRGSGHRRADRADHRGADARQRSSRPAGRSTGCFAPAATGFRNGTCRRIGSRIGTCSAGPRQNRAMAVVRPRLGGMTATRRRRSSGPDEFFPSPCKDPARGRVAPKAPGGGLVSRQIRCSLRDPHPTRFAGRPPPCRGR